MEYVFWTMFSLICVPLGIYPLSLVVLRKVYKRKFIESNNIRKSIQEKGFYPTVSFVVTVHNEESVIEKKLDNMFSIDYPKSKIEYIIASDFSTDNTNKIVKEYIKKNNAANHLRLLEVDKHLGKTYAQNYAVKNSENEIIVFSDANSLWRRDALINLLVDFKDESVGYVAGALRYTNTEVNTNSSLEGFYWNFDLKMREVESVVSSITGGNGAIYAVRKKYYFDFPPMISHDGYMPSKMIVRGLKAKFAKDAIVFEVASTDRRGEFKRKVRMNRGLPWKKYMDIEKLNIFVFGWFSYFYFGHKLVKYWLYFLHIALLIINIFLAIDYVFYFWILIPHVIFYLIGTLGMIFNFKIKILMFPTHYLMTIFAQLVAVIKTLLGRNSATWKTSR